VVDVVGDGGVGDRAAGAHDEAVDVVEQVGRYVRRLVGPVVVEVGVGGVPDDDGRTRTR